MRRAVLLGWLAVATAALAKPAPSSAPRWGDWVGDYTGKLTWTSCTAPGAGAATLPREAVDGQGAVDLTPAGGALEAMTLAEDGGGWAGQESDVTVHVTRPQPDTLERAVDLDSGCQVRGTLKRASTGIAACDSRCACLGGA